MTPEQEREIELARWRLNLTVMQMEILIEAAIERAEPFIDPRFFTDPELMLYVPEDMSRIWTQALALRDWGLITMHGNISKITPQGLALLKELLPWRWANNIDRLHGKLKE